MFCPICNIDDCSPHTYAQEVDFFTLFKVEAAFILDMEQLNATYLQLQSLYHPDRFLQKNTAAQQFAMQQSMWVNEAYATLKDPVKRAIYLLHQKGIDIDLDKISLNQDPEILMLQMEMSEQIEAAQGQEELASIHDRLSAYLSDYSEQFVSAYKREAYDEAQQAVIGLCYITKSLSHLKEV